MNLNKKHEHDKRKTLNMKKSRGSTRLVAGGNSTQGASQGADGRMVENSPHPAMSEISLQQRPDVFLVVLDSLILI